MISDGKYFILNWEVDQLARALPQNQLTNTTACVYANESSKTVVQALNEAIYGDPVPSHNPLFLDVTFLASWCQGRPSRFEPLSRMIPPSAGETWLVLSSHSQLVTLSRRRCPPSLRFLSALLLKNSVCASAFSTLFEAAEGAVRLNEPDALASSISIVRDFGIATSIRLLTL